MDMGLVFLAAGALCCVFPFVLFLLFSKSKDETVVYSRRQIGAFLLTGCLIIWGWTFKVHGLDEGLHEAAWEGDLPKVKQYLRWHADPNDAFEGGTALDMAEAAQHYEVADYIAKHGGQRSEYSKTVTE